MNATQKWKQLPQHEQARYYAFVGGVARGNALTPARRYWVWRIYCDPSWGEDMTWSAPRWEHKFYRDMVDHGVQKQLELPYKPIKPHEERDKHKRKPGPKKKPWASYLQRARNRARQEREWD